VTLRSGAASFELRARSEPGGLLTARTLEARSQPSRLRKNSVEPAMPRALDNVGVYQLTTRPQ
jgi:hypothetical protein